MSGEKEKQASRKLSVAEAKIAELELALKQRDEEVLRAKALVEEKTNKVQILSDKV